MPIKVIFWSKNTCIGGAADAAALYLRTELRYRDHKDGIRKLVKNHYVKNHYEPVSVILVQVKIEVTTGQKVNLEKNDIFDDNVFDFKDRTAIFAA